MYTRGLLPSYNTDFAYSYKKLEKVADKSLEKTYKNFLANLGNGN